MSEREILGVSQSADRGEIQAAFRKAAQKIHPDHNKSPEAAAAFARIKEARDLLLAEVPVVAPEKMVRQADAARAAKAAAAVFAQATKPTSKPSPATKSAKVANSKPTAAQIKREQELDRLARNHRPLQPESPEVRQHRKTLRTGCQRLSGIY